MEFDALKYNYPSRRNVVYGKKGMVATSHPLAAQAGLDILKKGGNAIDAAVAAAVCLTVVEPTSNGIGGDAFALVWSGGKLHGLNASGPAPASISLEAVTKAGHKEMPIYGWIPVNVPGAPSAWAALSGRFGRISLREALGPAIMYAEEGHPIAPNVAKAWSKAYSQFSTALKDDVFRHWFETFSPNGRAPRPGEIWRSKNHAASLKAIAETNAKAFYNGDLAEKIDAFSRKHGGFLRKEDLESFEPEWTDPVSINYRGYDVWELPPNGHGIVALMALNILKGFEFSERDSAETFHKQLEAMKLAYADGKNYIADPRKMNVTVSELLSDAYAAERRKLITGEAMLPMAGKPSKGGTVYLAAADSDGNMVSYIQSNYLGFGSGVVIPGTGISLHNRGCNFVLDPAHANCLEPGKKPYHTIIPGFLTKEGKAVGPFGVMGAFMQPQGHVQVVMNAVDFHMNPQDCLDAPRWQWVNGKTVEVENSFPSKIVEELKQKGHNISINEDPSSFGRGQIVWRTEEGALVGGTEPRTDGTVAAW